MQKKLIDVLLSDFVDDKTQITLKFLQIKGQNTVKGRWFEDKILTHNQLSIFAFLVDSINNEVEVLL